jgi:AraC-like DNA-binding protein
MKSTALKPLAFGDHHAEDMQTVAAAQDQAFRVLPGLVNWEFLASDEFQFKTAFIKVNGLPLASFSTSASQISFAERGEPTLVFPRFGFSKFQSEDQRMQMRSGATAIFVPPGADSRSEGPGRSVAVARLDANRLKSTLQTMLGPECNAIVDRAFQRPAQLDLRVGNVSFDTVFHSLFAQVNTYGADLRMLAASGLDDALYRAIAMLSHQDTFIRHAQLRTPAINFRGLDRVTQFVSANLGRPLTLTELERVGHMSRRALHNGFMKAFGMSPMGWVREQRLLKARELLRAPQEIHTVIQAVYACGFTNPSTFAAHYTHRFGERPSVTLQRSQGRNRSAC